MKMHLLTFTLLSVLVATPALAQSEIEPTQGNRFVTKDEFITNAGKKFDSSDVDGDGKLSNDERKSAIKEHHERRKDRFEDRRDARKERREDRPEVREERREQRQGRREGRREQRRSN